MKKVTRISNEKQSFFPFFGALKADCSKASFKISLFNAIVYVKVYPSGSHTHISNRAYSTLLIMRLGLVRMQTCLEDLTNVASTEAPLDILLNGPQPIG
jgi:hypothetical protein